MITGHGDNVKANAQTLDVPLFDSHGDTHVWSGNPSNTTTCTFVAVGFGRPGEPDTTFHMNWARVSFVEAVAAARRGEKEKPKP